MFPPSTDDQHGARERFYYKEFAAACDLGLDESFAEKLSPPAPDIRGQSESGEVIDFELVNGTWPETIRRQNQTFALDPQIRSAFLEAERTGVVCPRSEWNGLGVLVDFHDTATMRKRRQAISTVIEFLAKCGPRSCRQFVRDGSAIRLIHVYENPTADWSVQQPCISTCNSHYYASAVMRALMAKIPKRYATSNPLHLLVHCDHDGLVHQWQKDADEYLTSTLPGSQFDTVWVYDRGERAVVYSRST